MCYLFHKRLYEDFQEVETMVLIFFCCFRQHITLILYVMLFNLSSAAHIKAHLQKAQLTHHLEADQSDPN